MSDVSCHRRHWSDVGCHMYVEKYHECMTLEAASESLDTLKESVMNGKLKGVGAGIAEAMDVLRGAQCRSASEMIELLQPLVSDSALLALRSCGVGRRLWSL